MKNWVCLFKGEWKEDRKDGPGIYFLPDGTKWYTTFQNNKLIGEIVCENKEGIKETKKKEDFDVALDLLTIAVPHLPGRKQEKNKLELFFCHFALNLRVMAEEEKIEFI